MYPWKLRDGRVLPTLHSRVDAVTEARTEAIEAPIRRALASGGSALDFACNEGWYSQRLLDWGASRVLAFDVRAMNVRRARILRDHFGISEERLEFRQADVFSLSATELGTFDVVLCLGLIYHVEHPMGVLRLARACTRGLCVIESQVTRQTDPLPHHGGTGFSSLPASIGLLKESSNSTLASTPSVLSFVPNKAALVMMAEQAGFDDIEVLEPIEDRVLLLARTPS
jgi:hypothetical protein